MMCDYFIILERENNCNISTKITSNRHLPKWKVPVVYAASLYLM